MSRRIESDASTREVGLFPALLRDWRTRRGLSQLDLALASGVSSRHISFLETGRSIPGDEMVLRLAAALDVPLRQVNAMLRAAGHAPRYPEPEPGEELSEQVRTALDLMKHHHEPYPLVVIDRNYRLLESNAGAVAVLNAAIAGPAALGLDGLNLARLTLDPEVGGRIIANYEVVARELLWRMQRELLSDPENIPMRELLDEALRLPGAHPDWRRPDLAAPSASTVELQLRVADEVWSFMLIVSAIQAPLEVALDELRMELWFPADEHTAAGCARLAQVP